MANEAIASSMDFFSTRSAVALSSEDISSKLSLKVFVVSSLSLYRLLYFGTKSKKRRVCRVRVFMKKKSTKILSFSLSVSPSAFAPRKKNRNSFLSQRTNVSLLHTTFFKIYALLLLLFALLL
jgi:hypothetical protein